MKNNTTPDSNKHARCPLPGTFTATPTLLNDHETPAKEPALPVTGHRCLWLAVFARLSSRRPRDCMRVLLHCPSQTPPSGALSLTPPELRPARSRTGGWWIAIKPPPAIGLRRVRAGLQDPAAPAWRRLLPACPADMCSPACAGPRAVRAGAWVSSKHAPPCGQRVSG